MRQLIFRKNYLVGIEAIEKPELRLEAYEAIMGFAFRGEVVSVSPELRPLLNMITDSISLDFMKYDNAKKNNS